jgi:hypothetical protein
MVAVTDYFPKKDGYVADGIVIGFCIAEDTTMAAGSWVAFGTSVADYIAVKITAAASDAVGMCLRAPDAIGDKVPVAFQGVVKTAVHSTIGIGDLVSSSITTVTAIVEALGAYNSANQLFNAGTARILGTALQGGIPADEILVMLNKLC